MNSKENYKVSIIVPVYNTIKIFEKNDVNSHDRTDLSECGNPSC